MEGKQQKGAFGGGEKKGLAWGEGFPPSKGVTQADGTPSTTEEKGVKKKRPVTTRECEGLKRGLSEKRGGQNRGIELCKKPPENGRQPSLALRRKPTWSNLKEEEQTKVAHESRRRGNRFKRTGRAPEKGASPTVLSHKPHG